MALNFPDPTSEQTYIAPNGTTYIWNGTSWVVSPILPVSRGGTGFTTYAHGDILYGDSSNELNKLAAGTSGQALFTAGPGADPYWGTVSAGGGAGTVATASQYQIAGYYSGNGSSVVGSSSFTNDTSLGVVAITHATGSTSTFTGALTVFGGLGISGQINSSSIVTSGNAVFNGTLQFKGTGTFGDNAAVDTIAFNARSSTDFHPSTDNSRDLGNSTLGWKNFYVSGIGTLATLRVGTAANIFSTTESTTSSTGALTVSGGIGVGLTSYFGSSLIVEGGSSSSSTSTGALVVSGGVGIGGSLNVNSLSKFSEHVTIRSGKELRFYRSDDVNYTALKSANVSTDYTYTLPLTAGNSGEYLQTNGSGGLTWAAVNAGVTAVNAGAGISIPTTTGSVTVSIGRPVVLNLASGFTPVGIGTDYNIIRVPEGKNNTNTNYNIKKVIMGVGTTSSGTSTIRMEKSAGPHTGLVGFSNSSTASTANFMSADLSLIGAIGETSWITFVSGYGTVATGDRIRVNYTAVDAAHANFIIQCLLEEY